MPDMDGCPMICPCRRPAVGAFVLALVIWAAICGPIFLGGAFGALLAHALTAHVVPLGLAGWVIAFAFGLWLTLSGIRPALRENAEASTWLVSLLSIGGGAILLALGWHLPADWGPVWALGSEGVYVAMIAAGAAEVALDLGALAWEAGYVAAVIAARGGADFDDSPLQEVIENQAHQIEALRAERDELQGELLRAGAPAPELLEVLRFPAVRKAVLKALHRDSHPGISESKAAAFDALFQKANAVFARLEQDRRNGG